MPDQPSAILFLLEQLISDSPGDPTRQIERMERDGQTQLVNSDRLPTDSGSEGDAPYLALGFTFGEPDPSDELFRPGTLPPGWSRQPTDHAMWSKIVDQYGRERVAIFYKAAFYDRSAHMSLETRYGYLSSVLYDGGRPTLDDEWLTAAVARDELAAIARQRETDAEQADEMAAIRAGDSYWPGRAAEHRAAAAKARALAESLI
jgi:hypothetical protein